MCVISTQFSSESFVGKPSDIAGKQRSLMTIPFKHDIDLVVFSLLLSRDLNPHK